MEHNDNYKIPLSELLTILKADGYEVSIERILEVQSVLLSTPVSHMSLSELKYIITPILARNPEDQKNIYKIIDSYIADKARQKEKKTTIFSTWTNKKRLMFELKILLFVAILSTAVGFYFSQQKSSSKKDITQQPLPSDKLLPTVPSRDTIPQEEISAPGANKKRMTADVVYSGKPLRPSKLNIFLQAAGAFGLGLGGILYYIIFYERRKRMEAKKKIKDEESFAAGPNEPNRPSWQERIYAALQFPGKEFVIQRSKEFSVIRSNLKRPGLTERSELNVKRSVYATVTSAGYPTLAFDGQWKERKYLILVDDHRAGSHLNNLLNFFIRFLHSTDIPVAEYHYTTDIRTLRHNSGETISLEDLSYEFPGYHLIIVGDCHPFIDYDNMRLQSDLDSEFHKWRSKSIITSIPLPDWSGAEKELQNNFFHVVSADIEGIELLSKAIAEESPIRPGVLANRIRDKYSVSKYDLQSAIGVRNYLNNEELFQVVCALAVYPKLDWNITLALFDAIVKKQQGAELSIRPDYNTLLKIARIPWLSTGQWDESMRLQLLNFLQPGTEVIARETIIELLKEINPLVLKDSPAAKELQVQLTINSFFLFAHDPQQYKQYADAKNEFLEYWNNLDEWALKERTKNGLLPVNSKGEQATIEEFVLREEQFEKRNITLLRVALLILPAAILYILISLFKPSFAYVDRHEKVSFFTAIRKDSTCKKELAQVIVSKTGGFDTIAVKETLINYIPVNATEYNGTVMLYLSFTDASYLDVAVEAKDSVAVVTIKCP